MAGRAVRPSAAQASPAAAARENRSVPLQDFHPAVANWFARTFAAPTEAQAAAWPAIRAGRHTLVAAPTGSGKTLTAFLAALDGLVRAGLGPGGLADETTVVYVSPLKALSNDIRANLEAPLAGIRAELRALGLADVEIRTAVRTGDTTPGERRQSLKRPPHILVTTPESLYVLLGSVSGRAMLASVRTVIVDEIHAVAASKRGSHLALSLERLQSIVRRAAGRASACRRRKSRSPRSPASWSAPAQSSMATPTARSSTSATPSSATSPSSCRRRRSPR